MNRFVTSYWQSVLCALLVLTASLISGNHLPHAKRMIPHLDKLVHWFMYLGFTWMLLYNLNGSTRDSQQPSNIKWKGALLAILYGGMLEVFQHVFTSDRSADWWDQVANMVGVFTAVLTFKSVQPFWQRFFHWLKQRFGLVNGT